MGYLSRGYISQGVIKCLGGKGLGVSVCGGGGVYVLGVSVRGYMSWVGGGGEGYVLELISL